MSVACNHETKREERGNCQSLVFDVFDVIKCVLTRVSVREGVACIERKRQRIRHKNSDVIKCVIKRRGRNGE